MRTSNVGTSVYEVLAPEYYDPIRHPTCANFRQASLQLIKPWLEKFADGRLICEIGAGKSITAELLFEANSSLASLYLTDSAQSMLEYSVKWESMGAHISVAEASNLPFASDAFGLSVSSLGDPYNDVGLWRELARVMPADGYAIFTTPSYEWAARYRAAEPGSSGGLTAEFLLSDGRTVLVPSMIYDQGDQAALIASTRSMEIVDCQVVTYSQLPAADISPKLLVAKKDDLPIVTGYLVRRM